MQGLHLTADLQACSSSVLPLMADSAALRALCLQAVADVFHTFPPPGGVTGVVLLAESHLALHTWPELAAITLDIYVCNLHADNAAHAAALLAALEAAFMPGQVRRHRLQRGALR